MTPFDKAIAWQREHSTEPFEEILGWHLGHGLVYSTPTTFLLAHETHYDPVTNDMNYDSPPNAWFVQLAAATGCVNPIREVLRVATRPQPWAVWQRNTGSRLHAYPWNALAKKVRLS